jgi:hypothetical protein
MKQRPRLRAGALFCIYRAALSATASQVSGAATPGQLRVAAPLFARSSWHDGPGGI